MKLYKEQNFTRGWIVGHFLPSIVDTKDCEVGIKRYRSGEYESPHYHKIATEITAIISGKVSMNNTIYNPGDIVLIEPNETTDFRVIEDTITVVIKLPCVSNDKYMI